jgi:hypothetical protein
LSLLAAARDDGPLLCVIDDAHWLDEASAGALAFAARRLEAEGVAMLFAARGRGFRSQGIPELELGGLDAVAAAALLDHDANVRISPEVAEELVTATGGNPLALLELLRRLSGAQLQGAEPLPHPVPVGESLETAFAVQARNLSETARRALVLAATADTRAMRVPPARAVSRLSPSDGGGTPGGTPGARRGLRGRRQVRGTAGLALGCRKRRARRRCGGAARESGRGSKRPARSCGGGGDARAGRAADARE